MTKAIRIHKNGGPEVMQFEDVVVGAPAAGQIRLRQTAVGINYIDEACIQRTFPPSWAWRPLVSSQKLVRMSADYRLVIGLPIA